jgi:hypothetical protein
MTRNEEKQSPMQPRDAAHSDATSRSIAVLGLVIGATLGVAGAFAPSAALRGLAWGIDGTALVIASSLLAVHHSRRGNILAAAGFLVFVAGESLILSGSAMTLEASAPSFALVGMSKTMPVWTRMVGFIAALLFTTVAVRIFMGAPLTPLSEPLPFFAYPFFAATLFGWAWAHHRGND